MVGGTIPGLLVLGSLRKQIEQVRVNKPISSTLHGLCISSCLQVPALSKLDKPFPPNLLFDHVVLSQQKQPKTGDLTQHSPLCSPRPHPASGVPICAESHLRAPGNEGFWKHHGPAYPTW